MFLSHFYFYSFSHVFFFSLHFSTTLVCKCWFNNSFVIAREEHLVLQVYAYTKPNSYVCCYVLYISLFLQYWLISAAQKGHKLIKEVSSWGRLSQLSYWLSQRTSWEKLHKSKVSREQRKISASFCEELRSHEDQMMYARKE